MQGRPEKYYPEGDGDFSKGSLATPLHCRNRRNYLCSRKKVEQWGFEGNNR